MSSDDSQLVVISWYNAIGLRRIRFNDENVPSSIIVALKNYLFEDEEGDPFVKTTFVDVLDWIHETYRYGRESDGTYQRESDVFRTLLDGTESSVQRDCACVLLLLLLSAAVIRNKNNQQTARVKASLANLPAAQSALIVNVINAALCDSDRRLLRVTSSTIDLILDAKLPAEAHAQLVLSLKQSSDENANEFVSTVRSDTQIANVSAAAIRSDASLAGTSTPVRLAMRASAANENTPSTRLSQVQAQTSQHTVNSNDDAASKQGQPKKRSIRGQMSNGSLGYGNDSLSDSELTCSSGAFRTPERRTIKFVGECAQNSAQLTAACFTQPTARNSSDRFDSERRPIAAGLGPFGLSAQRFALRKRLRDSLAITASVHSPIEQEKYFHLREDFEKMKEDHEKAVRVLRKERDEMRAHLSELNDELETKNDALLRSQNENALLASRMAELSRFRDTQEELANVTQRLTSAQQKIRHLENALDKERAETIEYRELRIEYEQVTAREKQASSARAQLEDRIAQLESQLATQRSDCERKQQRIEKYREQLREKHEQLVTSNTSVSALRLQIAELERARRFSLAPSRVRLSVAPVAQQLQSNAAPSDAATGEVRNTSSSGTLTNNSLNDSVVADPSQLASNTVMRVVNPSLDESVMSTSFVTSQQLADGDLLNESTAAMHEAGESLGCVIELRVHELEAQLEALQSSSVPLERFLELEAKMRVAEQNLRVANEQMEDYLSRESQLRTDYEAVKRQSEFSTEEHRLRLETSEQALAAAHRQYDAVVKRRTELELRVETLVAANEQLERERAAEREAARAQNAKRSEEIEKLRHSVIEKDETVRRLETQLATTRSRLTFAESELGSVQAELDSARREFDHRIADLDAARSRLADRILDEANEDKLKVARAELQLARFEVDTKERELEALRAELNVYWTQLSDRNDGQKRLAVENDALKGQVANLTEHLAEASGSIRDLRSRCDDLECDLLAGKKQLELTREQLENEQNAARAINEQLAAANNELKSKAARIAVLSRELDMQRAIVNDTSQSFTSERDALNAVRSALLRDITELQSALVMRDERIADLQRVVSEWESKLAAAQRELQDTHAECSSLNDALATANTQLERARMQHDAAQSELAAIRARADQLESAARFAREELDTARAKHREELESLSQRVAEQVRDFGARQEVQRGQTEARRNEELNAVRERARLELSQLESRFEETVSALRSRTAEYEAARRANETQAEELAELRTRLLDRDAEVAQIESTNATLKALLEEKAAILEEKEATFNEIRTQLSRFQTDRDDALRRRLTELETETATLKRRDAERLQLEAEIAAVKRNAALEIAQLRRVDEENVQLKATVADLRRSNADLERASLQIDDARRAQLDTIVSDLRAQHELALAKSNQELARLAAELQSARDQTSRAFDELEMNRKQLQLERSQSERTAADLRNESILKNEFKAKWEAAVTEIETLKFELERCRADLTDARLRVTLSSQPNASSQTEAALKAEYKAKMDAALAETETLRAELERYRNELINLQLQAVQNAQPNVALQNETALKVEYKTRWEAAMRDAEMLKTELERQRAQALEAELRATISHSQQQAETSASSINTRRTSLDEAVLEVRKMELRSPDTGSARLSNQLAVQETNLDSATNSMSSLISASASTQLARAPATENAILEAPLSSSASSLINVAVSSANGPSSALSSSSTLAGHQRAGPKLQLCLGCEDEEPDGVEPRRLSELYRRNQNTLPHMRSCYPVETQAAIAPIGAVLEPPTTQTRKILRHHFGGPPSQSTAVQSFASSTVLGQPFSTPARDPNAGAGLLHIDALLPSDSRFAPSSISSLSATPSIEPAGRLSLSGKQHSVADSIKWEIPAENAMLPKGKPQPPAQQFKVPSAPTAGGSSRTALQPQNDNISSSNQQMNVSLRFDIPMSSGKQRKPPRLARQNNGENQS